MVLGRFDYMGLVEGIVKGDEPRKGWRKAIKSFQCSWGSMCVVKEYYKIHYVSKCLGGGGGGLLCCFEWGCIVLLNLVLLDFSVKPN